ncbi:hypothetical protein HC928_16585 [bacterium]|nr:hypothetical protein [bacterium]
MKPGASTISFVGVQAAREILASRALSQLEDDLMKRFGGERVKGFMSWANMPPDDPIEHNMISRSIGQAQVRVEGHNFDIRKRILEYDDVVNKQREIIYGLRKALLFDESTAQQYLTILEKAVVDLVDEFTADETAPDTWDLEALYQQLFTYFPVPEDITPESLAQYTNLDDLEAVLLDGVRRAYTAKQAALTPEIMQMAEKRVMLSAIDNHWQRHLTDLDILREGIGLMSIAQRDPLVEYKRESFAMFNEMRTSIEKQAVQNIFRVQIANVQRTPTQRQFPTARVTTNAAAESRPEPVRVQRKIGRNDPCWCGSGKKYKHCHLKQDEGAGVKST